ncbi:MAG: hypothetical protein KI793_18370 [Rivularia sp. (in: Bacteria)]|nr:hypothetical protein [Rivularia sp. MS3]
MDNNLTASLIKDIKPGAESSNPGILDDVNGNLLFTTFDTNSLNTQLWKTDGSEAGTLLIQGFGGASFPPTDVVKVNDLIYFLQVSGFTSKSLVRTDGTADGTFSIANVSLRAPADISNLTKLGDTVFYTGFDSSDLFQSKLFKIDQNTNQPVQVKQDISSGGANPQDLTAVDNTLFFSANANSIQDNPDIELWKSDGTDAGTVVVKDINSTASSSPDLFADVNGTLFFSAEDGSTGRELWKSDGTEAGTVLIKDINPGSGSSISPTPVTAPTSNSGNKFADVNGTFYFVADDGTNGSELWKSNGTEAGTVLVKDIIQGSEGSNPNNLTNVKGTLFFTVNDGSNGIELWKSDGSESGTTLVKDINPGSNSSNPSNLTNLDGILYFTADDGSNGVELWKSNGSESGTVLVDDINPGNASSNPSDLTEFNGELYFSADDGVNGRELWGLTDGGGQTNQGLILGTDSNDFLEGTEQDNTDILFEDFPEGGINRLITGVGDRLFFVGGVGGNQFFRVFIGGTDGTPDGTSELFFLSGSGNATGFPNDVTSIVDFDNLNSNLAFVTETTEFKDFGRNIELTTRLTISDGTESGTSVIKTFNPGESTNVISEVVNVDGTIFFAAGGSSEIPGSRGAINQLWKSDGTTDGTTLVETISLSASDIDTPTVKNLTDINGTLFFSGSELFKSNGTSEGTNIVKDINPEAASNPDKITDVNGIAFFTADDGINGTELWKSDGSESGTVLVKDITPGSQASEFDNLINFNGTLYFTVNDGSNGIELWKSDGSESGTVLVKDINPGGNSSNPQNLTVFQDILYFTADDGSNGVELWKSDGSESGTVLVGDINRGNASSNPENLTVVDEQFYFSADDGVNGRELWGLTEGGGQTNQDLILGGDSNDFLEGKLKDNIIDGLQGDDTLVGGSGKDIFVLSSEFGNDVITDFTLGEDEIINATDRIVFTTGVDGDSLKVAFSNTGDVLQVNLNGNEQGELENYLLNIGSNQDLPY